MTKPEGEVAQDSSSRIDPGLRAHATVEKPDESAQVWIVNGTPQPVDIYVNYAEQPAITDVKSMSVGSAYTVKGRTTHPSAPIRSLHVPRHSPTGRC